MKQKITPFLWFDGRAEEAISLYTSLFDPARIVSLRTWGDGAPFPKGQVMSASFEIAGQRFHAFDAGPRFAFNPTVSFFVECATVAETTRIWNTLAEGGKIMMPLDRYPWSERYGWVQDRFGISWQPMMGLRDLQGQRIIPALMFTGLQAGRAEEAIKFYTSVFADSGLHDISRYAEGEIDKVGTVKHARFHLGSQSFVALDSSLMHGIQFNEAISLYVHCETQNEIDYYWNALTAEGEESMCGWLKDPFGVSWQIVPPALGRMLSDPDRAKAGRVTQAMFKMRKLDLAALEAAYHLTDGEV